MSDEATSKDYARRVGTLIRDSRKNRGWTQSQLAETLGTSQSAINRIEQGNQNLSLDLLTRISEALDSEIVSLGRSGPLHLRVEGGRKLSGSIDVKTRRTPESRCCARPCSTRAAPPCARLPGSKRCTASSRCSTASA